MFVSYNKVDEAIHNYGSPTTDEKQKVPSDCYYLGKGHVCLSGGKETASVIPDYSVKKLTREFVDKLSSFTNKLVGI